MNMNPLNTQIYEEATEWIILHRSDDLDADAKRRFDAWLRESPQHLRAYLEMSTIWEDVPALNRDWNPSADELIARARGDINVFPLDLKGAGVGAFEVVGTVPSAHEAFTLEALNGLEPLEALNTSKPPEQGSPVPAELASASAEPALQTLPAVTISASQQSTFWRYTLAAAATVLIAVASGWFYLQRNTYTTDIGEQRTLALEDGSSVELNARTKIRVAFTEDARTIELLQGQALFKVAKNPNRPFIVDSDGTRVRAVGTQFDVYKKSTGTQITVVEGRVAVAAPPSKVPGSGVSRVPGPSQSPNSEEVADDRPTDIGDTRRASSQPAHHPTLQAHLGEVLVSAGEQILIADAAPAPMLAVAPEPDTGTVTVTPEAPTPAPATLTPQPANIEAATAWTQQRLVFDFATLNEVAEEFNRYNRRRLVIDCEADACGQDFHISGSFSSSDPTLLLRFLRDQAGIEVNETANEIRISRRDSNNG